MKDDTAIENKLWLALRFIALPAILLLPFYLVKFTGAKCFGSIAPLEQQIPGQTAVLGMQTTTSFPFTDIILWTLLIGFLLVSIVQIGFKKYRLRFQSSKQQFLVALASACVTVPLYIFMYTKSQLSYPPNWYCDSQLQLHGELSSKAYFGLGLTPLATIVLMIIYLLAPLVALLVARPKGRRFWTV